MSGQLKQKSLRMKLSEVENSDFSELKIQMQERSLKPIINFFRWTNWCMLAAILCLAFLEWKFPPSSPEFKVITDKVMIAAVGAVAVQSGAILIAAFKGLFSN
jgi:hypothetical protein